VLALSIKNLSKTYSNGHQALKDINLDVKQGQFLALLGKNGAGKTTLVEILSSLNNKTSGDVLIQGKDLVKDNEAVKSYIGIVPQEFNLSIFSKVIHVLITQAGYYGVDKKTAFARAKKHLLDLDLWEKREQPVITLSGGMKRRLMIARALMHDPEVIFLDEPTAGVDVDVRRKIWGITRRLSDEGKTIILATHYFEEAELLCDSLAVINNGEIAIHDSLSKVLNKCPKQKYIIELSQKKALKVANVEHIGNNKFEACIDKNNTLAQTIENVLAEGGVIKNIQPKISRLEELFLKISS